jgi:translation initiation factor IF-3
VERFLRTRVVRRGACARTASHSLSPARENPIAVTRTRINEEIRTSPVRLIDASGEQMGIVPLGVARESARESGMDLVEIAPTARPPVVRVMDWGKHLYQKSKSDRDARKRQHTVDVKEVKFRPQTEIHDLQVKLRRARGFLEAGKKVKVTVRYRGREMRRPELGVNLLDQVVEELEGVATVESRSQRPEARQLTMMLAPEGMTR